MKARILAAILIAAIAGGASAQTSGKNKGMAWGAGLGAIAGGIYGGHGSDALIGAAVGTGIGYIVGNESDKRKAQQMSAQSQPAYNHSETGPFPGTTWQLVDWAPKSGNEGFSSKTVAFGRDGWVTTTTRHNDGRTATERENYRVVGDTLIVNRGDYLINYRYRLQGNQLTVDTAKLRATLRRI